MALKIALVRPGSTHIVKRQICLGAIPYANKTACRKSTASQTNSFVIAVMDTHTFQAV